MLLTDRIIANNFGIIAHDWIAKGERQATMCNPDLNWPADRFPLRQKNDAEFLCGLCGLLRENRERREKADRR